MPVHARVWSGAGNGTVTDMTDACKRGKVCRTLTFLGDAARIIDYLCTTPEQRAARGGSYVLECRPLNERRPDDFDALCAKVRELAHPETRLSGQTVRGIDAPKPPLTAGVPGKWSAGADERG